MSSLVIGDGDLDCDHFLHSEVTVHTQGSGWRLYLLGGRELTHVIWPQPSSRPVSFWCPVFLSEYWARSMEKFAGTCDFLLCLQLPRILYFHPSPRLVFAPI